MIGIGLQVVAHIPCAEGISGTASEMILKQTLCCAAGWGSALQQSLVQTTKRISWDTWVLTAAAASLSWVLWRRHKRFLQTQHTSHTQANSETGVG